MRGGEQKFFFEGDVDLIIAYFVVCCIYFLDSISEDERLIIFFLLAYM
jgi:hypothetical protein